MSFIERVSGLLNAERRVKELEITSENLVLENTGLREDNELLETRAKNLEAALDSVLLMFKNEWVGPDQQAQMRAARAILEDQSWRR